MEILSKAKFIRLRSHHNKYLAAGRDGESVKQSKNGNTRQAHWAIEVVQDKPNTIRLRSCYDKFLTASNEPFLLGWTGTKAQQTVQTECNNPSTQWEPIREDFYVKLRAPVTGKFLRANSGTPPWKDTVTVDVPERKSTKDWVLWVVDIVDEAKAIEDFDQCSWPRNAKSLPQNSNVVTYKASYSSEDLVGYNGNDLVVDDESGQLRSSASSVVTYKKQSNSAMELFRNAKTIKLRSHHDKYLIADDDGESVCQDRHGGSKFARWTVEYVKSIEGVGLIRLKSCYEKYLTATDDEFLLGVTGKKVKQTMPKRLDSSIEWEPIREGMNVKLKTRYGNFLRANGGLPPWRNSITHDVPSRSHTQDWVLWEIEILQFYPKEIEVEVEEKKLERVESDWDYSAWRLSHSGSDESGASSGRSEGRVIHYNIVDDDGNIIDEKEEHTFLFTGNGVNELTQMLEEETGLTEVTLCSRSPLNGKLYPMRLELPPTHVKLHVYVVPSSCAAAAEFVRVE